MRGLAAWYGRPATTTTSTTNSTTHATSMRPVVRAAGRLAVADTGAQPAHLHANPPPSHGAWCRRYSHYRPHCLPSRPTISPEAAPNAPWEQRTVSLGTTHYTQEWLTPAKPATAPPTHMRGPAPFTPSTVVVQS